MCDNLFFVCLFQSILKQHALIKSNNGEISIEPASPGAKTKVNGIPLTGERVLKHFDRILFGKLVSSSSMISEQTTDMTVFHNEMGLQHLAEAPLTAACRASLIVPTPPSP